MSTLWRYLPDDAPSDGQQTWVDRGSASGPPFLGVWNLAAGGFISSTNSLLCFWFVVQRWKSQFLVTPAYNVYSTGPEGGPFVPAFKQYVLKNLASVSVDWTAGVDVAWIDIDIPSGSLAPGAQITITASLNADAEALPPDTYTAILTFAESTLGASEYRDATLIVS